ncbi:MAG: VacJ family lipoprotein, partial [Lentisphaeria bacterium]|nr:VacJ family lipoprotein [Lentisphaeria bacterium]
MPENSPVPEKITLSVLENHLAGEDPCEGFNRSMFAVTSCLMDYLADPLGRIYCSIFPRPFIEHFNNVCVNLEFPARAVSCLLRAEWMGAGHETARFLINLTVGIAGIFDPAEHWWKIHSTDSDFGQAFAVWGIGPGPTFILPVSPALNVRDTVGLLFDAAFDLKTYIPYSGWATALNRMVIAHRAYQQVVEGSNDRYKNYRELALMGRELKLRMWRYRTLNAVDKLIEEGKLPLPLAPTPQAVKPDWMQGKWLELKDFGPGTPMQDSLRTVFFRAQEDDHFWYLRLSVFNQDFSKKREERDLRLSPGRPALTYAFWPMPDPGKDKEGSPLPPLPEKLAILLPGIGGTFAGATPTAYAELLNRNGYAVLAFDSTFTWQFVRSRSGCRLPGFLPADAAALRRIIQLVLKDLKAAERINAPEIVLTGYSFGGMHTLKIAELEEKEPTLGIKKYLAVSPPADLSCAIEQADKAAAVMNGKKPQEVIDGLIGTAGEIVGKMAQIKAPFDPEMTDDIKRSYRIGADEKNVRFLAGLYFRSSLRSMLFEAHRERGLIPLKTPAGFT